MRSGLLGAGIVAAGSLLGAGCSSDSAPKLPALSDITGTLSPASAVVGPPTEIYARIARGAMACWFGPEGPLKAGYIFHGEAAPPSRGGKALIIIHERDPNSDNPKGLRAYRIHIVPSGDTSEVSVENLKLPEPLAQTMESDAHRWAEGAVGCADKGDEWDTQRPNDDQHAPERAPKVKKDRSA